MLSDPDINTRITSTAGLCLGSDTTGLICAREMRTNTIGRVIFVTITASSLLAFAPGCAGKKVNVWTPKPTVHWEQVSTQPIQPVQEGYRILVRQPTRALFPASMAVTRVSVEPASHQGDFHGPVLLTDPRNEFLQWNSTLDSQMAISEVFPIVDDDLGGGGADPEQILAAFRALHARLGLIYAVNELSPVESEMFGVLYDTELSLPIASLHASAVSILPLNEKACRPKPADPFKTDSRALVRAEFDALVHTVIRQLILNDERAPIEVQTGWTPASPTRPVAWPPRAYPTGG